MRISASQLSSPSILVVVLRHHEEDHKWHGHYVPGASKIGEFWIRVSDERSGEAIKTVVVLREEEKGNITEEVFVEWAKGKMAAYQYPRSVEFVDELPKSGTG